MKVMTRGRTRIEQGRGDAELGPADLVLLDPTRILRFDSTAATHVTILIPRRELRIRPAQIDRLIGVGAIAGSRRTAGQAIWASGRPEGDKLPVRRSNGWRRRGLAGDTRDHDGTGSKRRRPGGVRRPGQVPVLLEAPART
ncbi:hypothetical protein [Micromonospora sp. LOL_023]|uniref:AraC-like ligand-binding domain-containing protein n=1 Tax=Micromonospora sp. LOL_023 TaxID=3345418 RepID=UPI003A8412EB